MQQYGDKFGYFVEGDDKRLTPWTKEFGNQRISLRRWRYCKYCYQDTPQFVFLEYKIGNLNPVDGLLCCWQCGSGLEFLDVNKANRFANIRELAEL